MKIEKLIIIFSLIAISCQNSIDPIIYGTNACDNCKMTIVDKRFAAAFMNQHGKTFKFDDLVCLKRYLKSEKLDESKIQVFVNQFSGDNQAIDAMIAVFIHDESLKSPMNGNFAAFKDSISAGQIKSTTSVTMSWEDIK